MLAGLYQTPAIYVNVKGVMTNTVPTDAYRGAGRPEAAYLLERFVDHIARETGLTPDEIRARNLIKPSQIPFKTALGDSYDLGDFETVMRKGMEKADWKGFPARRAQSAAKGKWRGIGMATYVEKCSGGGPETVKAQFNDDAHASRSTPATRPTARATRRRCAQIASASLGIDVEQIQLVQGDSRRGARRLHRRQPHHRDQRRRDRGRRRQDHRQGQAGGGQRARSHGAPTSSTPTAPSASSAPIAR